MEKTRLELLEETLASSPDNTFVRYALALELANAGNTEVAWQHFDYLLSRHPDYAPTYYQAGRFLAAQGKRQQARQVITKGIEVTRAQGNLHASGELERSLADLGE